MSRAPVAHLNVRRHNLALALRALEAEGHRSRAGLADLTGLTRATVSSLVAELMQRGLVSEVGPEAGQHLGRPATLLQVDGAHVVTIGVEVNAGYTIVLARDLAGATAYERRHPRAASAVGVGRMVTALVADVRRAIVEVEASGRRVAGITIAIPGTVDPTQGVVLLAPHLRWRDVPLLERLALRLDHAASMSLDNEANLGALAEYRVGAMAGTSHLVYVLAANGIGGGYMVDGEIFRGASGGAVEFGHMVVQPDGPPCACGSRGCWESVISLRALLSTTVPDRAAALLADRRLGPEEKVAHVVARARDADPAALDGLSSFGHWLGMGLAGVVNVLNPSGVVLAGFLPAVHEWVWPIAAATLHDRALVHSERACRIERSTLGFSAAALGGALNAAERLFADPTLIAPLTDSIDSFAHGGPST